MLQLKKCDALQKVDTKRWKNSDLSAVAYHIFRYLSAVTHLIFRDLSAVAYSIFRDLGAVERVGRYPKGMERKSLAEAYNP